MDIKDLPKEMPIFPLGGVLLLPDGQLPLHIFQDQFKAMLSNVMGSHRMIGMVQSKNIQKANEHHEMPYYQIGCAGRVTDFSETEKGNFMITLTGVCRFSINHGHKTDSSGFKVVAPDWSGYEADLQTDSQACLDRPLLKSLLEDYFDLKGLTCNWSKIDEATDKKLITCLSMICPFSPSEKQALLEATDCTDRARIFMAMIDMAVRENHHCSSEQSH